MAIKMIWSGKFLDGHLKVFCEENELDVIHFRIDAYDMWIAGTVRESGDTTLTPREKMEIILETIKKQYLKEVLVARTELVKDHGYIIQ